MIEIKGESYVLKDIREDLKAIRKELDEAKKENARLQAALDCRPKCAKCRGTGQEYRSYASDYIDCRACDGKGF